MRLGISLSGGGIRSAAFSLGVCQRLAEKGLIARASYLSAVSGGSYIAAGMAISHAESQGDEKDEEPPRWGRNSPEETALRRNLTYLAPGSRGRLWLFANILYGLILNLIPLVLGTYVCGRLAGILLETVAPGFVKNEATMAAVAMTALAFAAGFVFAAVAVVGIRRFFDRNRFRERLVKRRSEMWVWVLLMAAGLVLGFGLVLPAVLLLLTEFFDNGAAGLGPGAVSFVPQRVVIALAIIVTSIVMGGIAVWLLRRRRIGWLRNIFAYLSGLGILLAPFLLGAQTGAAAGFSTRDNLWFFGAAGLVLLGFAIFVHNRRYSMHLFYRERLQHAFALRRVRNPTSGEARARPIPYEETIKLSEIEEKRKQRIAAGGPAFPKLVMCAAVAARGSEVPNKAWAASFTFEGDFSGSASAGVRGPTADLERGDWLGGGDVTLPSMMAISGAAISPLMGRFTLPGFRFLMAMLNVRLGVWLRNPSRGPAPEGNEGGLLRRALHHVLQGWREPGSYYVLKEGLGLANTKKDYVYVSDGGHWENLGLTELLRRHCTSVVVVDASGDPGLGDIGRAMSAARAELGVEFDLDPSPTIPDADGLAKAPVVEGKAIYPEGHEATIFYTRSVLWKEAPSDLRFFAEREHPFPNHPTSNQFLSGELFDAYRALGWAVGDLLTAKFNPHPEDW